MKKGLKIVSLILNALTFAAVVFEAMNLLFGIYEPAISGSDWLTLSLFWSIDIMVIAGIASLIKMIADIVALAKHRPVVSGFPAVFKYIATVGTFAVAGFYWGVIPALSGSLDWQVNLTSFMLYTTTVVPFLSLVSFIFFEKGRRIRYRCYPLVLVIPAIFSAAMVLLQVFGILSFATYPPLDLNSWTGGDIWGQVIYLAIALGLLLVFGILLLVFHNIRAIRPGAVAEPKEEVVPAPKAEEPQPAPAAAAPAATKQVRIIKGFYSSSKVTHVSRLESGEWQVRSGIDGSTVNFRTQAEAIRYANAISKETGGSVRIHARHD